MSSSSLVHREGHLILSLTLTPVDLQTPLSIAKVWFPLLILGLTLVSQSPVVSELRNAVRAIVVCLRSMVDGAMAMVDGAMAMVDGR